MSWQLWVVAALHTLGVLITVCKVGKERQPTTPFEATATVVLLLVILALMLWGSS